MGDFTFLQMKFRLFDCRLFGCRRFDCRRFLCRTFESPPSSLNGIPIMNDCSLVLILIMIAVQSTREACERMCEFGRKRLEVRVNERNRERVNSS